MGWRNPPVPWSELERRLGDAPAPAGGRGRPFFPGDGGDSPAWSRKRPTYEPPAAPGRSRGSVPYAELHAHTHFSFLDGACSPEAMAEEAARLGLEALAVTDHDGFYGVVRAAEAARALGLPTIFGSELTLGRRGVPVGEPDPGAGTDERHLVVLARDPRGYALLARAISEAQLRGEKGGPRLTPADLCGIGGTGAPFADQGHWLVLTGCRKGAVPAALETEGPAGAARRLGELVDTFGRDHVAVELWDHGHPLDSARNDALAALAVRAGLDPVATTNAHYAAPAQRPLATAIAAVRAGRSLDELDGWLPAAAGAHLRSGVEMARRFARFPGVVERAAELGRDCAFDLHLVAPALPPYPCPDGLDEMGLLRRLTEAGAEHRYGPRGGAGSHRAWTQIDHELDVIAQLGFPGYFLIVWDIVEFCRRQRIYCQGRGSAANSAVCFALGITKADAVALGLLFERFLSPERDGPPDIDVDIESGRREEVIQYVYERYGRRYAAQVANVITYRGRSAVRDMAKALGYAPGQQDAWAKQVDRWSGVAKSAEVPDHGIPEAVLELAAQVEHAPRHLGIHSGGMVLCDRPVIEVCPVEWARHEGRTVLQWDKDDCAAAGLVKFDLLGLGMLTALHRGADFVAGAHGLEVDLATIPQDDAVYDMLCAADSIGVFQVESRAQMATLPRLKPRTFYDLVVEVALIRPGPIQGGSVHPYIRRRNGTEPVTYLHPLLEGSLAKTLGVPLFQEQLMQMAIDVAGFSAGEADQLRQAMGSKRSRERMERLRARLYDGMAERGITGEVADRIYDKLAAFANFGFPESHSVSFAYLVYASSYLKRYFPAAFCAGLLDAQPMGFYAPHTLVADARRHGVEVRTPDLNASRAGASLEWVDGEAAPCRPQGPPDDDRPDPHPPADDDPALLPRGGRDVPQPAVRLGLSSVRTVGGDLADTIVAERDAHGPYTSMEDLARRVALSRDTLEALATAGVFARLDDGTGRPLDRRRALWAAGAVAQGGADRLAGVVTGVEAPPLPGMSDREVATADLWATGVAPDGHPTRFVRHQLAERGVVTATGLAGVEPGSRVLVGGVVTHRQRPATAGGTTFLNLEDETGLINVVVSQGCWARYRRVARTAPAMLVRGRLERAEGVTNVVADKLEPLPLTAAVPSSRDFR
ncbi:error-prone DNA polymerase [Rhabdothermincola salaria]|uniref:error-prone DNA polymerase n=1 Tax=Rhabdothermincola salaria TaxID=2903142 RepID=UPI001E61EC78|nr:error-prone DNA polymerase [Rhabdothermincola salaria]MCD9623582.1 error-prone DNA polymerase [Rhabdothermincola salaria]